MGKDLKVGDIVSHKTIPYLKKGRVHSFTKYNGVIVDWSDKGGVMFRRHKYDSLIIFRLAKITNRVIEKHSDTLNKL